MAPPRGKDEFRALVDGQKGPPERGAIMGVMTMFCRNEGCRGHGGMTVRQASPELWVIEVDGDTFLESAADPICPLCGAYLLHFAERLEGVAPTTPEEQQKLAIWSEVL